LAAEFKYRNLAFLRTAPPSMHSYIDLFFTPESLSPLEISKRVHAHAGLSFIIGPHDLAFEWKTEEEFHALLSKVHDALKGTGVFYRVETIAEDPAFIEPIPWPPPMPRNDPFHPAY
jgi:hypothetical protein